MSSVTATGAGRKPPSDAIKARAQLHVLFETANCRKILVVNDRQFLPGAALRSNVAGGIPDRQSTQNLTIMFADHTSYRPHFPQSARFEVPIIVAGHSFRNCESKDRTRIIKLLVSL